MDSDWAGDFLGRKSTTGVIVRRGKHLLRHMSCLQTLVAPSNREAEYCALIRGACTSLGIQSHYLDWITLHDATESTNFRVRRDRRGEVDQDECLKRTEKLHIQDLAREYQVGEGSRTLRSRF